MGKSSWISAKMYHTSTESNAHFLSLLFSMLTFSKPSIYFQICIFSYRTRFEDTELEEEAEFILYNTCTVRENANLKVYGRLGKCKHRKDLSFNFSYNILWLTTSLSASYIRHNTIAAKVIRKFSLIRTYESSL